MGEDVMKFQQVFTPSDHLLMKSSFPLAEAVAEMLGPCCEVVIHSLESIDVSVVKIVNGYHTGRNIGAPITDKGLKILIEYQKSKDISSRSYFSQNKKGETFKSTTQILLGENQKPIGLFCININVSYPMTEFLKPMMPDYNWSPFSVNEHFASNTKDIVRNAYEKALLNLMNDNSVTRKNKNKLLIQTLHENGIFELKDAVFIVAEKLEVTKHAVYKILREFKQKSQ